MTPPTILADHPDGLTLLLGRRQAEVMRFFWARGQATAREVRHWLAKDSALAYTTVATMCVRLVEKGLLDQQRIEQLEGHVRHGTRYLYTPRISEHDFVRNEISEHLARLLAHYPALVCEQVARYTRLEAAHEATAHKQCASADQLLTYLAWGMATIRA